MDGRTGVDLAAGIWFREEVREMTIFADQYDFAISLLILGGNSIPVWHGDEMEEDVADRFSARSR